MTAERARRRFLPPLLAVGLLALSLAACSSEEVNRNFPAMPSTGFQPMPPQAGPNELDRRSAEAQEQHRRDVVERGLGLKRPVSPILELPATSQRFCSAAELTAYIRQVDEDARTAFDEEVEASNYRRAVAMRSAALIGVNGFSVSPDERPALETELDWATANEARVRDMREKFDRLRDAARKMRVSDCNPPRQPVRDRTAMGKCLNADGLLADNCKQEPPEDDPGPSVFIERNVDMPGTAGSYAPIECFGDAACIREEAQRQIDRNAGPAVPDVPQPGGRIDVPGYPGNIPYGVPAPSTPGGRR